MNKENIRKVIEAIRKEENFFCMEDYVASQEDAEMYGAECGSPSCICGWANHIYNIENNSFGSLNDEDHAADFLGISRVTAGKLFCPDHDYNEDWEDYWKSITREQAIAVLENLIETGDVDWRIMEADH